MLKPLNVATPDEKVGTTAASKEVWPLAATAAARFPNDRSEPSEGPEPKFSALLPLLSRADTETENASPDRTVATELMLNVRNDTAKALLPAELIALPDECAVALNV